MTSRKPSTRPRRPFFGSGPTAKPPGYAAERLDTRLLGRNIRAPAVMERFEAAMVRLRRLLSPPDAFAMVYVPGSETGAMEAAMWNLLGPRRVQVLAYEVFGKVWATDALEHLKLSPEILDAPFGRLPDLSAVRPDADLVFAWNGTTSGVRVPNADFVAADREGLTICDATSAAFAMPLDWAKLDVVTFSFQKALGGEAGLGVAVLSPRAIARLDGYQAPWPIPKVIRLRGATGFERSLARGQMINTFSILTIEDLMFALDWAEGVGGLEALIARTNASFSALSAWVARTPWVDFLAEDPATRSTTSVCLKFTDPRLTALDEAARARFAAELIGRIEAEGAAIDLNSHRLAPAGLRIWCGATVDPDDVAALTPWLDWAFESTVAAL